MASLTPSLEPANLGWSAYYEGSTERPQSMANLPSHTHLPITPNILRIIFQHLHSSPDQPMFWAACCISHFGFLRAGEVTVPIYEPRFTYVWQMSP